MADFNLSVMASDLNAAVAKANAAAPQSTTYTKAQVDAAIAAEATARQTADMTQTAALTNVINSGAKNIADTSKVVLQQSAPELTFSLTDDVYSIVGTANPEAANYRFLNLYFNDTTTVMIPPGEYTAQLYPANPNARLVSIVSGSTSERGAFGEPFTFAIPDGATNSWLRVEIVQGTVLDWQFKLMIAPKAQYAISSDFEPYTPTLAELYQMVKALQNS